MALGSPAHVVLIDLERDADAIRTATSFSDFQRSKVPTTLEGTLDASRVVVVGSVRAFLDEGEALRAIIAAQSVSSTVCVLRGAVAGDHQQFLELPRELGLGPVAPIWVDDPRGVLWSMRTAKAQALTVYDGDPRGDTALNLFVNSLRVPEVFDDVFTKSKELGTLVSPGFRIFVPGATDAGLNEAAEVGAVTALTSGGSPDLELSIDYIPGDLESRSSLFGQAPAPAEFFDAQGPIGLLSREIDARLEALDAAVHEITGRPPLTYGPIERANRAITAVGESIAQLKAKLRALFAEIEGSDGLNAAEVRNLRSAGLRSGSTKVVKSDQPDEAEGLLRKHALSELRRTRALKEVVRDLRHVEERAKPRTAAETVALLEQAASEQMIEMIRRHPPLRVMITDIFSLLIVLAMFIGAGVSWRGTWLMTAICLGGLCFFFFLLTHPLSDLRGLSRAGLRRAARARELYLVAGTALFGIAGGQLIRDVIDDLAVRTAGAVVAVGSLVLLARYAWQRASRRWIETADLAGAQEARRRMLELTASVAINDWVLAESRVRFASVAGKLAASLEALRVALLSELAPGKAEGGLALDNLGQEGDADALSIASGGHLACNPAIRADLSEVGGAALYKHSAKLEEIVLHDYLDAIAAAIEDHWAQIALGDEQAGELAAVGALRDRLSWYRRDLKRNGLFGTRASVDGRDENALSSEGRQRRRELLSEIWQSLDVDSLLSFSADAALVQFCTAETLVLLDQDPGGARMTRFAPASGAGSGGASDIIQTNSMLTAGVMRLVPLRTGTVVFGQSLDVAQP